MWTFRFICQMGQFFGEAKEINLAKISSEVQRLKFLRSETVQLGRAQRKYQTRNLEVQKKRIQKLSCIEFNRFRRAVCDS